MSSCGKINNGSLLCKQSQERIQMDVLFVPKQLLSSYELAYLVITFSLQVAVAGIVVKTFRFCDCLCSLCNYSVPFDFIRSNLSTWLPPAV